MEEVITGLRRVIDSAERAWASPLVATPAARAQALGALRMHRAAVDRLDRAWARVERGEIAAAQWAAAAEDIRRAIAEHARDAESLRAPIMAIASAVTPDAVVDALDRAYRSAPAVSTVLRWGALAIVALVLLWVTRR